jgi:hypothetical protein
VGGGGRRGGGQSVAPSTIALLGNSYEGMEKVGIPIPRAMRICHVGDFTVVRFDDYLPTLEVEVSTQLITCGKCHLRGWFGTAKQQSVISCRRCHLSSRVIDGILLSTPCFCRYASKPPVCEHECGCVPAKVPSLSARVFVRRRNYHADWKKRKAVCGGLLMSLEIYMRLHAGCTCVYVHIYHACMHCGPDWMSCCACSCMARSFETRN